MAWTKSVDTSRAGLAATLLVKAPESSDIYVNFDKSLVHLCNEAKVLLRLGIPVPERARTLLLQEDKFMVCSRYHALRN